MSGRTLLLQAFVALFLTVQVLNGQTDSPVHFFPSHQLLRQFVGDGMAHRFGAAKLFGNRQLRGSTGSVIPVMNTEYLGLPMQASVAASVHAQLDLSQSISLMSTEFVVDFFLLDVQPADDTIVRLGISHTSHHLGDNSSSRLQNQIPLDYSRDYVQLFFVQTMFPVRVYAGTQYAYNFVVNTPIKKPWWLQTGVDGEIASFEPGFKLYAGCDVKIRQEMNYATTQRYELGLMWPSNNGRNLRFSLAHQAGVDERGQFFTEHIQWNSIGVAIEL